ncbi:hypothetical protein G7Y89_g3362 [Cudoniella acicularis]|uniref:Uncharacterized protein n=1 Tax=Cudoniella acicularis TaxID=354080 RepID=A0A8H4RTK3_9HELO|nr:hypothetical protein G7Y89_g3362 [Cudoniella acicularis]
MNLPELHRSVEALGLKFMFGQYPTNRRRREQRQPFVIREKDDEDDEEVGDSVLPLGHVSEEAEGQTSADANGNTPRLARSNTEAEFGSSIENRDDTPLLVETSRTTEGNKLQVMKGQSTDED